jgi:hypothetical protein
MAAVGAVLALAGLMIIVAWSNVDRLTPGWRVALGVSTLMGGVALACLAFGRSRVGGVALLVAALTAPTGFAFLINVVVVVLAVALIVVPAGERRGEVEPEREGARPIRPSA